jgi:hypothetical protein
MDKQCYVQLPTVTFCPITYSDIFFPQFKKKNGLLVLQEVPYNRTSTFENENYVGINSS